jgi:hypothetical protein
VRYIALGAVFIQIRWLIAQHRHSLKCIIVNALYIAYIKRFYIANDKTQSSVVRRKAAFVSWLSVLGAPSWCARLRRFGDVHLVVDVWSVVFRFFSELLFFACTKNK